MIARCRAPVGRLAVYGSLSPGGPNHHVLCGAPGEWFEGAVEGELRACGWGADLGFPGLVLGPGSGRHVRVHVLESAALVGLWDRLDAFEGDGYERVRVEVFLEDGTTVPACIYALRPG